MENVFDTQFYVIFAISVVGLVCAAVYLRHVISKDLADIVVKQYQNMFDKIDLYIEKFKDLDRKVSDLKDKYEGLEERAYKNKDGIERIEKKLEGICKVRE